MIAACPTCGARYRIDTAKLRPEGARLRCSRCEKVFRVRLPEPAEAAPQPAPRRAAVAARPAPASPPPDPAASPPDRSRLVLLAHPEVEAGKAIADELRSWGLEVMLVHDGVEAILNVQRALPRVVVLDAALPKMFGFQVCELMKRNESLRSIHVVLVGAIHDQDRYRRPPGELYGADAYVERQHLPGGLAALFRRFGLEMRSDAAGKAAVGAPEARPNLAAGADAWARGPAAGGPAGAGAAPAREPAPAAQPAPTAEAPSAPRAAPPAADPGRAAEREQAERLARIIVSDIVLYNAEKFEAGMRAGDVVSALADELAEGRALFAQRVDAGLGAPEEFLERELVRVARSRGMA